MCRKQPHCLVYIENIVMGNIQDLFPAYNSIEKENTVMFYICVSSKKNCVYVYTFTQKVSFS